MNFTELNEQINHAVSTQSTKKIEACATLEKQIGTIKEWFDRFTELTNDAREFGKSLKDVMHKFHFGRMTSVSELSRRIKLISFHDTSYYIENDRNNNPVHTGCLTLYRNIYEYGSSWFFRLVSINTNSGTEPLFEVLSETDYERILKNAQNSNYPALISDKFGSHSNDDSWKIANFWWTVINNVTPEELAEVYNELTVEIIENFIESIETKNDNLAEVIEKANEELKAYNEKHKTVVTENEDGSVEIKINGKIYVGTVKEQ